MYKKVFYCWHVTQSEDAKGPSVWEKNTEDSWNYLCFPFASAAVAKSKPGLHYSSVCVCLLCQTLGAAAHISQSCIDTLHRWDESHFHTIAGIPQRRAFTSVVKHPGRCNSSEDLWFIIPKHFLPNERLRNFLLVQWQQNVLMSVPHDWFGVMKSPWENSNNGALADNFTSINHSSIKCDAFSFLK